MTLYRLIATHGAPLIYALIAGGAWSLLLVAIGIWTERRKRTAIIEAELARRDGQERAVLEERCRCLEAENEHLMIACRSLGLHIDEAYELRRRRA